MFLPDYDIGMAEMLYPGCDVWLNNPLRPLEACGTSGMKAAMNGALNLSILDGWWDEMYDGDDTAGPSRRPMPPATPASATPSRRRRLYDLLEHQVAPRFYERDATACRSSGCAASVARSRRSRPSSAPTAW